MQKPHLGSPFAHFADFEHEGFNPHDFVAIVLCAGLGTRLRPLTKYISKPTAPIGNTPVAFGTIKALLDAGIDQVHCNTHYLAEFAESELCAATAAFGYAPERLRFWRESELLETGGGIAAIVHQLARLDPLVKHKNVIVVSGDIWAPVPLGEMLRAWKNKSPTTASLMVTKGVETPRKDGTWVDVQTCLIKGFGPNLDGAESLESRMFTTHQILTAREILACNIEKRSSIDLFYRAALARGETILNVMWPRELPWFDIGNYSDYLTCVRSLDQDIQSKKNDNARTSAQSDKPDQAIGRAYALPKQCLVIQKNPENTGLLGNEKTSKHMEFAGIEYYRLALLPDSCTLRCINRLLTVPKLDVGMSFVQKLSALLPTFSPPSTTSGLYTPFDFPAASFEPFHFDSSLIFALDVPELSLPYPVLVPLELLEAPSLTEGFFKSNPYELSQTYFLFTLGRSQQ